MGSAAGGGLPQWNCACEGCTAARKGEIPCRTQTSLAVSVNGQSWFLINASPDLRAQLQATPVLHPAVGNERGIPLEGILLTNADLDHTLGLILMRESDQPLHVHAPADVRKKLVWADDLLGRFSGIVWHEPPAQAVPLLGRKEDPSGLTLQCVSVSAPQDDKDSVAYIIGEERTGKSLLIAPDVGEVSAALAQEMARVDAIFWDGTFWSNDELSRVAPTKRDARGMGHLPLSETVFEALAASPAPIKVLIHINNTNPILLPGGIQRRLAEAAGITIGEDGMIFNL